LAYRENDFKYAVVVNRRHGGGLILNAVAHAACGIRARLDAPVLDYPHGESGLNASISLHPFIVLAAKGGAALAALAERARADGVAYNYFTTAMIRASAEEQVEANRAAPLDALDFVCVVLYGPSEAVDPLTRKFSLYRDPA
jgi:hypothetical protein